MPPLPRSRGRVGRFRPAGRRASATPLVLSALLFALVAASPRARASGGAAPPPGEPGLAGGALLPEVELGPYTLLYVPNATALAADGGALADGTPTILGTLFDTNVVSFSPGFDASAVKVHSTAEFNVRVGDEDGDGDFFETIGDDVDALGVVRHGPALGDLTNPDLVFSSQSSWGNAAQGLLDDRDGALDGSLFRLRREGPADGAVVELFLPEVLLTKALGQGTDPLAADVDVDAFAQDAAGNLYLSFREDELVDGVLVEDDGVVVLPALELGYDSKGDVDAVGTGKAVIAVDKGLMSSFVQGAGLKRASGSKITTIGNLQALDLDPAGGTFTPVQPVPGLPDGVPNLLFNGERLGATVLTTAEGGTIARLNGQPLGTTPINGRFLGLDPEQSGSSGDDLNGLVVVHRKPPPICLDVMLGEADVQAGEPVSFVAGNLRPGGYAWLLLGFEFPQPGAVLTSLPAPSGSVYPDLFLIDPWFEAAVPVDGTGRARIDVGFPSAPPSVSFLALMQVLEVGSAELSPPAAVWCP